MIDLSKVILILITVISLIKPIDLKSQSVSDTLFINHEESQTTIEKLRSTNAYAITKSAIPLFAASALATTIDYRLKETRDFHLSSFKNKYDDYIQYVPMVTMFGMKIAGVEGRSSWGEMLTADVISAATMAGIVNGLKYTVKRMRPDNSKKNSFPSGHTATAFMSATMLYKEYGELSPWVGIGSYGCASLVAVGRMLNNRHWMSDVLFGAGVGIFSTELGYFLSDLIFKKNKSQHGFYNSDYDYTAVSSYLEYSVGYSCLFPHSFYIDGQRVNPYQGMNTSLAGAYFFKSGWGIGGSTTIMTAKISKDKGTLGSALFFVGPEYTSCICPRIFWNAKLHFGSGNLLLNDDLKKRGFAAQAGLSLLGQVSPTMGLRLYTNYTYTTLSGDFMPGDLSLLNVGLTASMLF